MCKRAVSVLLAILIMAFSTVTCFAEEDYREIWGVTQASQIEQIPIEVLERSTELIIDTAASFTAQLPAKSFILMEQTTGKVIVEQNADEQMAPASITKIMTILLIMEAIEQGRMKLEDVVTCSPHASSMGGSQIWFEPGEQMSVNDLLKAAIIGSANDASVALGEHLSGSEEAFVDMMNQRAKELGMQNTHFVNATGLDADGHLTTARDIAIMSRELLRHDLVKKYSTIWMDSLRNGETQLVNTNKLVRFYNGTTGLKTGTTDSAGKCLAASAERGGLSLVAVSLGSASSDERFACGKALLDFGFANYMAYELPSVEDQLAPVRVRSGVVSQVSPVYDKPDLVVIDKGDKDNVTQQVTLSEDVTAPIEKGQTIGKVVVSVSGEKVAEYPLKAAEAIDKMTFGKALQILGKALGSFK